MPGRARPSRDIVAHPPPLLPFLNAQHQTCIAIIPTAPFLQTALPAKRAQLLSPIWANVAWLDQLKREHKLDETSGNTELRDGSLEDNVAPMIKLPAFFGGPDDIERLASEICERIPKDGTDSRAFESVVGAVTYSVTVSLEEGILVLAAPVARPPSLDPIVEAASFEDGVRGFIARMGEVGGEMGIRIRDFDWSKTTVGPISSWSIALRTQVMSMLNSPYRMYVCVGPSKVFIYNTPYIEAAQTKHPWILGKPFAVAWPEVYPLLLDVIKLTDGGKSMSVENHYIPLERNSILEETYHSYCFSPFSNEAGQVLGLTNINFETTESVRADRRMKTVRSLVHKTATARTVPDFCDSVVESLDENPYDLPFVLLYTAQPVDPKFSQTALKRQISQSRVAIRLTCRGAVGVPTDHPFYVQEAYVDLSPPIRGGSDSTNPSPQSGSSTEFNWPFEEACRKREPLLVEDITTFASNLGGRAWGDNPRQAVVVPIFTEGSHAPQAVVIFGLNPRSVRDDELYKSFRQIVSRHLGIGLLSVTNAEAEAKRAEELLALNRAKTSFFSNASHELRTPLTLVLGPLQDVLARDVEMSKGVRDKLELVSRNATRLLSLVNKLLDYSALEAGKMEMKLEPTDLGTLTTDLASLFRDAIERAGLTLVVNCEKDPPKSHPTFISRELFARIIFNVLGNALKYTNTGEIVVSVKSKEESVVVDITDSGIGIPEDELEHIFERFHRVAGAGPPGVSGTGIGLALTLELVRAQRGSLDVKSELGVGSTFSVTFKRGHAHLPAEHVSHTPISDASHSLSSSHLKLSATEIQEATSHRLVDDTHTTPLPSSSLSSHGGTSSLHSEHDYFGEMTHILTNLHHSTILLVDDSHDLRSYIAGLLQKLYNVVQFSDGQAAYDYAIANPPSLVLTDQMMPRMSGNELFAALRAHTATRNVPIIMLSAQAGAEARSQALEAGMDDYLVKPFQSRELLARVRVHLQLGRMRAELESRVMERTGELNDSELRYRALARRFSLLTEVSPVGIFMLDASVALVFTNPRWHVITGHPLDRPLSSWMEAVYPEDKALLQKWSAKVEGGQDTGKFQCRFGTEGEPPTWVQLEFIKCTEFGKDISYVGTLTDISAQKHVEALHIEAVEQRAADADANRRAIENFIDIVSHETRNPLSGVWQNAEMVESSLRKISTTIDAMKNGVYPSGDDLNDLQEEFQENIEGVGNILVCAAHQRKIADDIINVSKLNLGLMTVDLGPCDIVHTLNKVLRMFEADCQKKDISLSFYIDDSIQNLRAQWIQADPNRLAQSTINFFGNACKFTSSPGSISLLLEASETRPPSRPGVMRIGDQKNDLDHHGKLWVSIGVQDTGSGLTPQETEKLFMRFSQVERTAQYGGSGLGLFVTKKLVELHEGFIEVESVIDQGSTFRFIIPVDRCAEPTEEHDRPSLSTRLSSSSTIVPKRKIQRVYGVAPNSACTRVAPMAPHVLVVEDNLVNSKVLTRQLTSKKYKVTPAYNGEEALALLLAGNGENNFDVVLCDIEMPILSGLEAIKILRAKELESNRPVPYGVIALTGNGRQQQLEEYLQAGFTQTCVKPYNFARLLEEIEEIIGRSTE